MDQFEIAIALEPANPYAFNLVGEALLQKGHAKEAIPVLARAVELQPADHRVQGLLDEAMRLAHEAHAHQAAREPPRRRRPRPPRPARAGARGRSRPDRALPAHRRRAARRARGRPARAAVRRRRGRPGRRRRSSRR